MHYLKAHNVLKYYIYLATLPVPKDMDFYNSCLYLQHIVDSLEMTASWNKYYEVIVNIGEVYIKKWYIFIIGICWCHLKWSP